MGISANAERGTTAQEVAFAINEQLPRAMYQGRSLVILENPRISDQAERVAEVAVRLTRADPWIAMLQPGEAAHFVIVEHIDNGLVYMLDPWGAGPGTGKGAEVVMTLEEFVRAWIKVGRYGVRKKP